jgi:hypothetical protein
VKFELAKTILIVPASPLEVVVFVTQEMLAPTPRPLNSYFKLLLNSVLSCKGAQFSSIDLKNFYLDTPMPDPEYVHIKITDIPAEFIEEYKLAGRDRDDWDYFEIR